jgi:hypothetical protein
LKEWITMKEAAMLAERNQSQISRWISSGKLVSHNFEPGIYVKSGDVLRVEEELRNKNHRLGS